MLRRDQFRWQTRSIVDLANIEKRTIEFKQVVESGNKPTSDDGLGYIVSTMLDSAFDTRNCCFCVGKTQEECNDAISIYSQLTQHADIASPRQGCFKTEVDSLLCQFTDPCQKQSSSPNILRFGREGCQPRSNQICIQELVAFHEVRQKCRCKCRLACSIRACDHIDCWLVCFWWSHDPWGLSVEYS